LSGTSEEDARDDRREDLFRLPLRGESRLCAGRRGRWLGARLRHDGVRSGDEALPEDVEAQCENCFRNIARALEEAGASLADLVRVRIFVTSQAEFERIMPIIRKHCYVARPTNTTVLAQLVAPHMRVEIEATARLRRSG